MMQMPATLSRLFDFKLRSAKKQAKLRLKEAARLLRRGGAQLPDQAKTEISREIEEVHEAHRAHDTSGLLKHTDKLSGLLGKYLGAYRKPAWRESFESIAVAVLVALLLRSFVVEAFKIPTGSMIPTLAIGDQIFVNKYIYGIRIPFTSVRVVNFAAPKRGEVVVFVVPIEPHEDYIKRVVGIPGDEIQVRHGALYLNGAPVPRQSFGRVTETDRDGVAGPWHSFDAYAYGETLDDHTYTVLQDANMSDTHDEFGPYVVPDGHVFVMGDNRDHSYDGRAWSAGGMSVPTSNILGRALFVWWSWGKDGLNKSRLGTWID